MFQIKFLLIAVLTVPCVPLEGYKSLVLERIKTVLSGS